MKKKPKVESQPMNPVDVTTFVISTGFIANEGCIALVAGFFSDKPPEKFNLTFY